MALRRIYAALSSKGLNEICLKQERSASQKPSYNMCHHPLILLVIHTSENYLPLQIKSAVIFFSIVKGRESQALQLMIKCETSLVQTSCTLNFDYEFFRILLVINNIISYYIYQSEQFLYLGRKCNAKYINAFLMISLRVLT